MIDRALSNKISNMSVICAMLVVMTHVFPKVEVRSFTWCVDRFIFDGLGRVAVPYFFIVSGFFLARHINESGWWWKALWNRVRTLLVPYVTWNLLWGLMPMFLAVFANLVGKRSLLANVAIPAWGWGMLRLPPLYPTWYIRTLLLFVVLSPIFITMLRTSATMTLASSFILYTGFYRSVAVPFGTWEAIPNTLINLEGLAFFLVGLKLAMDGKAREVPGKIASTALMVSLIGTIVRMYCKAGGHVFLYNHIRFLVIPGFMWVLWKAVPPVPWPKWLTSSAFAIYLIHPFAIFWFRRFASASIDGFIPYCACAVTAILVPMTAKFAMQAISPRVTSFLFGGR